MDPHQKSLAELKRLLAAEPDLGVIFKYFFDHLGENHDFNGASEQTKHPILRGMVIALSKQVSPKLKESDCMTMFSRYRKTPFYHGALIAAGCMGSVIYFEDIGKGCLGVTSETDGLMHYLRFSPGGTPGPGPTGEN